MVDRPSGSTPGEPAINWVDHAQVVQQLHQVFGILEGFVDHDDLDRLAGLSLVQREAVDDLQGVTRFAIARRSEGASA